LADLSKINRATIQSAGPRYTPTIDANAPNLKIRPLVDAIEALTHSPTLKGRLELLEKDLRAAWRNAPNEIRSLFDRKLAATALCANYVKQLRQEKPGASAHTIRRLCQTLRSIERRLEPYEQDLYEQRIRGDKNEETRNRIASRLSALQEFQQPIGNLREYTRAPDLSLIQNNLMFLKGGWGAGKTHLLCDVVKARMDQSLPTLFILAQSLPRKTDPLAAACETTGIAPNALGLLKLLNQLGQNAVGRALLIIDGINEGDRSAWRRYMASFIRRMREHPNIALILSCRTPFDHQILSARSRIAFVEVRHTGFEDIEFDAQREFFRYYGIPTPHIPLLAPEFSRPLFLKILCESIASLSQRTKHKRINDFAAGHKGMTKLLEDFVLHVGKGIEADYLLPRKSCWRLLKGQGDGPAAVGISVLMAERGRDYVYRDECIRLINQLTGIEGHRAEEFLARLITDGLLIEHATFEEDSWKDVVRLPYQRFSDHLISRHLLSRYLRTESETVIRRSFYANRPLGRIFQTSRGGWDYEMPGLVSAIMLEFPERVKRVLPGDDRELVFYLPGRSKRHGGLVDAFLEGLLWRSTDSFSAQTDRVVATLLNSRNRHTQEEMLETLVCLASRTSHPYSAERLYRYFARQPLIDRDIFWSEFLRSRSTPSAVYRVLDWIITTRNEPISAEAAGNLIWLCALFLTSTVRRLRDRATRCLVLLGERYPHMLLSAAAASFSFNDPYVPERMSAASYGVLMRKWAFPPKALPKNASEFASDLLARLKGSRTTPPIEHILMRDYAEGIVRIASKLSKNPELSLDGICVSQKSAIPSGYRIAEKAVEAASAAIHMDFGNYTVGRLIEGRANYDDSHDEYRRVRRQIRWRILNLGYDHERLKDIDRQIASSAFHIGRSENGKKIDRYGKKYSWIAYYEVAGRRRLAGTLPDRHDIRISDADIDPSFPDTVLEWRPPLLPLFAAPYGTASEWMAKGASPNYRELLERDEVDNILGPWVLLEGFINERSSSDPREAFTFLRGLIVRPGDQNRLGSILTDTEYPGNNGIPDSGADYYLFAGEIGWSSKYGQHLRGKSGRAKPQWREALARSTYETIEKPYGKLTGPERASLFAPSFEVAFGSETLSLPKR
jgi:hypothetical protein